MGAFITQTLQKTPDMIIMVPTYFILNLVQIPLAVLEKKIFEGFLPIMGMATILIFGFALKAQTLIPPSP